MKSMFYNWVLWQCDLDADELMVQVMRLIFMRSINYWKHNLAILTKHISDKDASL